MNYNQEMLESRQLLDYISLGKELTRKVAEVCADNRHNDFFEVKQIKHKDGLKQQMSDLIDLENQLKNGINASVETNKQIHEIIKNIENEQNEASNDVNVNQIFDEKLTQICERETNFEIESDIDYKKLMEILNEFPDGSETNETNNGSFDEDLVALENDHQTIPTDPFSKRPIENPVRNKICGHIYDREQLERVLQSRTENQRLRCPYVGCNNRTVTLNDVVPDRKTKALIDSIKRQNRSK